MICLGYDIYKISTALRRQSKLLIYNYSLWLKFPQKPRGLMFRFESVSLAFMRWLRPFPAQKPPATSSPFILFYTSSRLITLASIFELRICFIWNHVSSHVTHNGRSFIGRYEISTISCCCFVGMVFLGGLRVLFVAPLLQTLPSYWGRKRTIRDLHNALYWMSTKKPSRQAGDWKTGDCRVLQLSAYHRRIWMTIRIAFGSRGILIGISYYCLSNPLFVPEKWILGAAIKCSCSHCATVGEPQNRRKLASQGSQLIPICR